MKRPERIGFILLVVLLAAAVAGVFLTRRPPTPGRARRRPRRELVDQRPLQTARNLAALATTPGERAYAGRALRLADDEVDLTFATALRDAVSHPPPPSPETHGLVERVKELEDRVTADQALIGQLKLALSGKNHQEVQQQLDLAQGELSLDQDALNDAKQDLSRAGGDLHSAIQHLLEEHEATSHANAANQLDTQTGTLPSIRTLASQFRWWQTARDKYQQLEAAEQEANGAAAALTQSRQQLEAAVKQERTAVRAARKAAQPDTQVSTLTAMQQLAQDEKNLADFARRIQHEEDLAGVYHDWAGLVAIHRQRGLNAMLQSLAWILVICLVGLIANDMIGRFEARIAPDHKMLRSLRFVARFGVQAVALILILLVIFGAPSQMTTLLGLAGAGLTVALKDFIVAFFGWFVLMGKNGIRVGDWVELNGISGEVVEVGVLRTVLLETGNWGEAGHPTGRKVVFVNSFAIEGHYFNFSTTGQWLWDELEVLLPNEDPYPLVDAIQKIVGAETAANASQAEQEWQRAARGHSLRSFSASPAINVKPTAAGLSVTVRYITRAHERYELRSRVYRAIVELLRSRNIPANGRVASAESA